MLWFWSIAALLLLWSLAVIISVLLKNRHYHDIASTASSADIYKQYMDELDVDIKNGLLSKTAAQNLREEIKLSLLNPAESKLPKPNKTQSMLTTASVILLLISVPSFVISFYHYYGRADLIIQQSLLTDLNQAKTETEKTHVIEKMLAQIEHRLVTAPDDVGAWTVLTNTYTTLKRYQDALRAINQLYRLKADDPTVLLRYAEIISMANDGEFNDKASTLINKALELDPTNINGLWLAGLAAYKQEDFSAAKQHWQNLQVNLATGSEFQQKIKMLIADIDKNVNAKVR